MRAYAPVVSAAVLGSRQLPRPGLDVACLGPRRGGATPVSKVAAATRAFVGVLLALARSYEMALTVNRVRRHVGRSVGRSATHQVGTSAGRQVAMSASRQVGRQVGNSAGRQFSRSAS